MNNEKIFASYNDITHHFVLITTSSRDATL
jgi:hypothetical protein